MGHVFLSYSREDQDYARKLADDLRSHDLEVWLDDRLDFGDRWWRTIVKQIHACAAFVVVMTPEAEESEWVEREILLAQRRKKPIFPLLLRGEGHSLLITTQHADVTGDRLPPKAFYRRLRRALPSPAREFEPELVHVPAGPFLMGSKEGEGIDRERPQHTVTLSAYWIGKYPVTNAAYQAFVRDAGHKPPQHWDGDAYPKDRGDHPVVYVSWEDAAAYCQWLSKKTQKDYRLPTEAQWEKAARGTDGRTYPWGDAWDAARLNSFEGGRRDTSPVGRYSPDGDSPYGCADVAGNVWEWCADWFDEAEYARRAGLAIEDPEGPEDGTFHVLRGGSFANPGRSVRCAFRHDFYPNRRYPSVGFRVVVLPLSVDGRSIDR